MSIDFTIQEHRRLLTDLRSRGYSARSYSAVDPASPHLVIRHDVDMSTRAARILAESEAADDWSAHYFFLTRTEFYNLRAKTHNDDLKAIIRLGHKVGLHFDAAHCMPEKYDAEADADCRFLEDLTGFPVDIISFHRPAAHLLDLDKAIAGRSHTYMPRYYSQIGYCSDSQGAWRFGLPKDNAAVLAGRALQLLTHAIWWVMPGTSPAAKLDHFLREMTGNLDRTLADNCIPWRQHRQEQEQSDPMAILRVPTVTGTVR